MPDLSVKGIARRYGGRAAPFLLREVFGIPSEGAVLRPILESMAREEYSFDYIENCGTRNYGGTAKFTQIWTHIVVRINLNFDTAIPNTTRNTQMTTWRDTIQRFWSLKWGCSNSGEATCRLTFEVQWTSDSSHHTVRVTPCIAGSSCRENSGRWFDNTMGSTAAHEFGHLLGLKDEYNPTWDPTECPNRNPVDTGTIMDSNVQCFPARLMTRFADNIESQIVAIPEWTHNPALCT